MFYIQWLTNSIVGNRHSYKVTKKTILTNYKLWYSYLPNRIVWYFGKYNTILFINKCMLRPHEFKKNLLTILPIKPFELYLILLLHAHTWRRNCLSFRNTWVHLLYLAGFRLPDLWFSVLWLQIIVCLLSFFFGPLYCLFFLDLWLLVIPFVSSSFSCEHRICCLL